MRLPQVVELMAFLRDKSRKIRQNNQRISEWVDEYVNRCVVEGKSINLLTQWCVTKNLERRSELTGGRLVPTKEEILLFQKYIPEIVHELERFGIRFNWWITFNRPFLESRRISHDLEMEYKRLISSLASPLVGQGWLEFLDWEDDIIGGKISPNQEVLNNPQQYVGDKAMALELKWNADWEREETDVRSAESRLYRDVCYQIACEAAEGLVFTGRDSPFGEFILIPLEVPEQYVFFGIFSKDFKKRIVSVLPFYPWRLKFQV